MEFPVDLLASVDPGALDQSAKDCMSKLLYRSPEIQESFTLPDSKEIAVDLCNVSFVPLYGYDTEHKILALYSQEDIHTAVGFHLLGKWWSFEDILRTADPLRTGLLEVRTPVERIVLHVLNKFIYKAKEKADNEDPFLCHKEHQTAKILWKDGKAIGFYSFIPEGTLCDCFVTQCYQLPVMDTIFIRKCYRGKGYGLQMLENFVHTFRNDRVGLKYPLSETMYKVCKNYLSAYPADKQLLWEVHDVGAPYQRTLISKNLQTMELKEHHQLVRKLNFETENTDVLMENVTSTPAQKTGVEHTVMEVVEEEVHLKVTKEVKDTPVTTLGRSGNLKRKMPGQDTEATTEKTIRVEAIKAAVQSPVHEAEAVRSALNLKDTTNTVTRGEEKLVCVTCVHCGKHIEQTESEEYVREVSAISELGTVTSMKSMETTELLQITSNVAEIQSMKSSEETQMVKSVEGTIGVDDLQPLEVQQLVEVEMVKELTSGPEVIKEKTEQKAGGMKDSKDESDDKISAKDVVLDEETQVICDVISLQKPSQLTESQQTDLLVTTGSEDSSTTEMRILRRSTATSQQKSTYFHEEFQVAGKPCTSKATKAMTEHKSVYKSYKAVQQDTTGQAMDIPANKEDQKRNEVQMEKKSVVVVKHVKESMNEQVWLEKDVQSQDDTVLPREETEVNVEKMVVEELSQEEAEVQKEKAPATDVESYDTAQELLLPDHQAIAEKTASIENESEVNLGLLLMEKKTTEQIQDQKPIKDTRIVQESKCEETKETMKRRKNDEELKSDWIEPIGEKDSDKAGMSHSGLKHGEPLKETQTLHKIQEIHGQLETYIEDVSEPSQVHVEEKSDDWTEPTREESSAKKHGGSQRSTYSTPVKRSGRFKDQSVEGELTKIVLRSGTKLTTAHSKQKQVLHTKTVKQQESRDEGKIETVGNTSVEYSTNLQDSVEEEHLETQESIADKQFKKVEDVSQSETTRVVTKIAVVKIQDCGIPKKEVQERVPGSSDTDRVSMEVTQEEEPLKENQTLQEIQVVSTEKDKGESKEDGAKQLMQNETLVELAEKEQEDRNVETSAEMMQSEEEGHLNKDDFPEDVDATAEEPLVEPPEKEQEDGNEEASPEIIQLEEGHELIKVSTSEEKDVLAVEPLGEPAEKEQEDGNDEAAAKTMQPEKGQINKAIVAEEVDTFAAMGAEEPTAQNLEKQVAEVAADNLAVTESDQKGNMSAGEEVKNDKEEDITLEKEYVAAELHTSEREPSQQKVQESLTPNDKVTVQEISADAETTVITSRSLRQRTVTVKGSHQRKSKHFQKSEMETAENENVVMVKVADKTDEKNKATEDNKTEKMETEYGAVSEDQDQGRVLESADTDQGSVEVMQEEEPLKESQTLQEIQGQESSHVHIEENIWTETIEKEGLDEPGTSEKHTGSRRSNYSTPVRRSGRFKDQSIKGELNKIVLRSGTKLTTSISKHRHVRHTKTVKQQEKKRPQSDDESEVKQMEDVMESHTGAVEGAVLQDSAVERSNVEKEYLELKTTNGNDLMEVENRMEDGSQEETTGDSINITAVDVAEVGKDIESEGEGEMTESLVIPVENVGVNETETSQPQQEKAELNKASFPEKEDAFTEIGVKEPTSESLTEQTVEPSADTLTKECDVQEVIEHDHGETFRENLPEEETPVITSRSLRRRTVMVMSTPQKKSEENYAETGQNKYEKMTAEVSSISNDGDRDPEGQMEAADEEEIVKISYTHQEIPGIEATTDKDASQDETSDSIKITVVDVAEEGEGEIKVQAMGPGTGNRVEETLSHEESSGEVAIETLKVKDQKALEPDHGKTVQENVPEEETTGITSRSLRRRTVMVTSTPQRSKHLKKTEVEITENKNVWVEIEVMEKTEDNNAESGQNKDGSMAAEVTSRASDGDKALEEKMEVVHEREIVKESNTQPGIEATRDKEDALQDKTTGDSIKITIMGVAEEDEGEKAETLMKAVEKVGGNETFVETPPQQEQDEPNKASVAEKDDAFTEIEKPITENFTEQVMEPGAVAHTLEKDNSEQKDSMQTEEKDDRAKQTISNDKSTESMAIETAEVYTREDQEVRKIIEPDHGETTQDNIPEEETPVITSRSLRRRTVVVMTSTPQRSKSEHLQKAKMTEAIEKNMDIVAETDQNKDENMEAGVSLRSNDEDTATEGQIEAVDKETHQEIPTSESSQADETTVTDTYLAKNVKDAGDTAQEQLPAKLVGEHQLEPVTEMTVGQGVLKDVEIAEEAVEAAVDLKLQKASVVLVDFNKASLKQSSEVSETSKEMELLPHEEISQEPDESASTSRYVDQRKSDEDVLNQAESCEAQPEKEQADEEEVVQIAVNDNGGTDDVTDQISKGTFGESDNNNGEKMETEEVQGKDSETVISIVQEIQSDTKEPRHVGEEEESATQTELAEHLVRRGKTQSTSKTTERSAVGTPVRYSRPLTDQTTSELTERVLRSSTKQVQVSNERSTRQTKSMLQKSKRDQALDMPDEENKEKTTKLPTDVSMEGKIEAARVLTEETTVVQDIELSVEDSHSAGDEMEEDIRTELFLEQEKVTEVLKEATEATTGKESEKDIGTDQEIHTGTQELRQVGEEEESATQIELAEVEHSRNRGKAHSTGKATERSAVGTPVRRFGHLTDQSTTSELTERVLRSSSKQIHSTPNEGSTHQTKGMMQKNKRHKTVDKPDEGEEKTTELPTEPAMADKTEAESITTEGTTVVQDFELWVQDSHSADAEMEEDIRTELFTEVLKEATEATTGKEYEKDISIEEEDKEKTTELPTELATEDKTEAVLIATEETTVVQDFELRVQHSHSADEEMEDDIRTELFLEQDKVTEDLKEATVATTEAITGKDSEKDISTDQEIHGGTQELRQIGDEEKSATQIKLAEVEHSRKRGKAHSTGKATEISAVVTPVQLLDQPTTSELKIRVLRSCTKQVQTTPNEQSTQQTKVKVKEDKEKTELPIEISKEDKIEAVSITTEGSEGSKNDISTVQEKDPIETCPESGQVGEEEKYNEVEHSRKRGKTHSTRTERSGTPVRPSGHLTDQPTCDLTERVLRSSMKQVQGDPNQRSTKSIIQKDKREKAVYETGKEYKEKSELAVEDTTEAVSITMFELREEDSCHEEKEMEVSGIRTELFPDEDKVPTEDVLKEATIEEELEKMSYLCDTDIGKDKTEDTKPVESVAETGKEMEESISVIAVQKATVVLVDFKKFTPKQTSGIEANEEQLESQGKGDKQANTEKSMTESSEKEQTIGIETYSEPTQELQELDVLNNAEGSEEQQKLVETVVEKFITQTQEEPAFEVGTDITQEKLTEEITLEEESVKTEVEKMVAVCTSTSEASQKEDLESMTPDLRENVLETSPVEETPTVISRSLRRRIITVSSSPQRQSKYVRKHAVEANVDNVELDKTVDSVTIVETTAMEAEMPEETVDIAVEKEGGNKALIAEEMLQDIPKDGNAVVEESCDNKETEAIASETITVEIESITSTKEYSVSVVKTSEVGDGHELHENKDGGLIEGSHVQDLEEGKDLDKAPSGDEISPTNVVVEATSLTEENVEKVKKNTQTTQKFSQKNSAEYRLNKPAQETSYDESSDEEEVIITKNLRRRLVTVESPMRRKSKRHNVVETDTEEAQLRLENRAKLVEASSQTVDSTAVGITITGTSTNSKVGSEDLEVSVSEKQDGNENVYENVEGKDLTDSNLQEKVPDRALEQDSGLQQYAEDVLDKAEEVLLEEMSEEQSRKSLGKRRGKWDIGNVSTTEEVFCEFEEGEGDGRRLLRKRTITTSKRTKATTERKSKRMCKQSDVEHVESALSVEDLATEQRITELAEDKEKEKETTGQTEQKSVDDIDKDRREIIPEKALDNASSKGGETNTSTSIEKQLIGKVTTRAINISEEELSTNIGTHQQEYSEISFAQGESFILQLEEEDENNGPKESSVIEEMEVSIIGSSHLASTSIQKTNKCEELITEVKEEEKEGNEVAVKTERVPKGRSFVTASPQQISTRQSMQFLQESEIEGKSEAVKEKSVKNVTEEHYQLKRKATADTPRRSKRLATPKSV